MTIDEALTQASMQFAQTIHRDTARLDANVLMMHVLGCSSSYLLAWPDTPLTAAQHEAFFNGVNARVKGEPIALIVGQQEFWSLPLTVNAHTLVPRPDTECLIDYVLAHYAEQPTVTVWDAGTGSGAIALALAKEKPGWQITASDISADALAVAQANQKRLGLAVDLVQADWLTALAAQSVDILISNPPYIRDNDPHLAALTFEPIQALVADREGLACIEQIVDQSREVLRADGLLIIEHGYDQAHTVQAIFQAAGLASVETHKDYAQQDRFTVGVRHA